MTMAGAGGVIAPLTSQTGNLIKRDTEDQLRGTKVEKD